MNKSNSASKIKMKSFDDLFGTNENLEQANANGGEIREIPLASLHTFRNHPFQIHEDKLEEMVESVRQYGVLVPGIARMRPQGGYEIIAGHTRKAACELAGLDTMPMFIRNLNDDEANIVNTGNASVDALAEMNISGNVTPVNWYKTILRENGKPYLLAICVLSEIVYWYRPVEVRDEHSGMTIGYRRKFREDLLQKTYNDFAEQFGESRRSVKAAFDRLEEIGVIRREFRNIETNSGMVLNNVMYIDLCVDKLYTCTYLDIPGDDEDVENTGEGIQKQAEYQANKPVTKFCTTSYKTLYDPLQNFV